MNSTANTKEQVRYTTERLWQLLTYIESYDIRSSFTEQGTVHFPKCRQILAELSLHP